MYIKNLLQFFLLIIISSLFLQVAHAKESPNDIKKYIFKFNGKVTCNKLEGDIAAMYGAKVKLYALRKKNINSDPEDVIIDNLTGIGLNPKDLVADVAPDGSFTIDVEFASNLQLVTSLFLEVYPGGDQGYVVSDEKQFVTETSKGEIYLYDKVDKFSDPFRGIKFNFDQYKETNTYDNINIEVNSKVGVAIRQIKLSFDLTKLLFITMPPTKVIITNDFPGIDKGQGAQTVPKLFSKQVDIYVRPQYASEGTSVRHEYGHCLHYAINRPQMFQLYGDHELRFREGFAEFFAMAVQDYAIRLYHELPSVYEVADKLAFTDPPFNYGSYSGTLNNDIPRFATYLFNLYDGPSQQYIQPKHQGRDNDDIDGKKEGTDIKIFTIIKNLGKYEGYISDFHSKMKSSVSPDVAASIQKSYNFIFNDNKAGMPCAQVKEAKMTILEGGKTHALQLKTYAYTDPEAQYYKNKATGYKLYGKQNNNWKLIKTLPETDKETKLYTLDTKDIEAYTNFKVSAYNASGESLHPVFFKNSSLSVSIEGPTDTYADVAYQWNGKVSGNYPYPLTYSWKVKDAFSDQYYPIGQTGPSKSFTTEAPVGKNFILQLFVTDKVAVSGYTEVLINTTIRPLKASINGASSITANEATKWTASIEGGLPPYSYIWTKKIEGDFKDIIVGQNNNCTIKADKNFTLKLVVKDAQGNSAFSTKEITINPFAPITSSITGDKIVYLHQAGNWQTEIAGGQPPYLVNWLKKKEGQNYSLAAFAQGLQCSNQLQQEGVFYLKTLVKDANGILKESPEFKVTAIYQPMYAVIENENVVLAQGEKIDWKASVVGGKPGYKYQWKVGKSLDALTTISENSSINPITSCAYQSKFNDFGKFFIVLSVTDEFNKTVSVYKEFTVKEKPIVVNTPIPSEELNRQNIFNFSPNPVQNSFTLSYKVEEDAYVELSLIDSKDKSETKLYQQQCTKGSYQKTFNTGLLKSGVYIIQLKWRDDRGINTAVDKMIIAK